MAPDLDPVQCDARQRRETWRKAVLPLPAAAAAEEEDGLRRMACGGWLALQGSEGEGGHRSWKVDVQGHGMTARGAEGGNLKEGR